MVYIYALAPIDFWSGCLSEAQYLAIMERDDPKHIADVYMPFRERALAAATRAGWEGDMRQGPFISALPTDAGNHPDVVLAWKQQNNGSTFVACVHQLPWLGRPTLVG